MVPESTRDVPSYRVTFFFGPEPVEGRPDVLACVFNVKKRSWKAGIQISVEMSTDQLAGLQQKMRLADRLAKSLMALDPQERPHYQERMADCFAQAVCWCKLDLRLQAGMAQESQRIQADELAIELDREAGNRVDYVLAYILGELDLAPDRSLPSSC
ncbi:hypothetical protein [Candidatus Nitrospira nitrificans]|uniref:Uncharacterized protein n=1 Tax=Candidatus Nitrospira nitrificans TaxID=1742973 RepID=A0A0S4LCV5_9BACT|nr:hypothetical protein [Candidatus Nitrospira nitrificans]CUS33739.1 conserved hypothetical protein [Candidatus Nitrospira nitrificans]